MLPIPNNLKVKNIKKRIFSNSANLLENVLRLSIPPTLKSVYSIKLQSLKLYLYKHYSRDSSFEQIKPNSLNGHCGQCLISLLDGPASFRLEPAKKKSKFAKRVLKKSGEFSQYQKTYFDRIKHHRTNKMVIKCKFCGKVYCIKPTESVKRAILPLKPKPLEKKKKKKKKKNKDKYCGLNQNIVDLTKKDKNDQSNEGTVIDLTTPVKGAKNKTNVQNQNNNKVVPGKIAKNIEKRKKAKLKNALSKLNNLLNTEKPKKDVTGLQHFLANL